MQFIIIKWNPLSLNYLLYWSGKRFKKNRFMKSFKSFNKANRNLKEILKRNKFLNKITNSETSGYLYVAEKNTGKIIL